MFDNRNQSSVVFRIWFRIGYRALIYKQRSDKLEPL